jgi:hypothetical protein
MDYDLQQNSVCLEWQTQRALTEIARAKEMNADVMANGWIADKIKAEFPQVVEHIKGQSERTKQFRKDLAKQLNPKPF